MKEEAKLFKGGETVLIASGLLFILSSIYIASGGEFLLHFAAKALYLIGVIIFLFRN